MNLDKYKKTGNFTLSSGKKSNTYYDLKEAMGEPAVLSEMIDGIIGIDYDVIIGIDYGGTPLAVALSLRYGVPYAILRKEKKQYAMWHRIEGYQGKGRVLLVDDVSTTGNSMKEAREYLKSEGYDVVKTKVIMERNELH